jgi:hypothetical protein
MSSSDPVVQKYIETFNTLQQSLDVTDPPQKIVKAMRRLSKQGESLVNFTEKLTCLVDIAALVTSVDNVLEEVLDTLILILMMVFFAYSPENA